MLGNIKSKNMTEYKKGLPAAFAQKYVIEQRVKESQ